MLARALRSGAGLLSLAAYGCSSERRVCPAKYDGLEAIDPAWVYTSPRIARTYRHYWTKVHLYLEQGSHSYEIPFSGQVANP